MYDMHIIHCNLKLKNILVNIIKIKIIDKIIWHNIVKLINFGISKIEVRRNPKAIENNYIYNIIKFIALKA